MSQNASEIPPHGLGKLHISDFWKSLFLAAIVNLLLGIYPIINSGSWPTLTDFQDMLKSTVAIIIAYLIKNLSTNNVGQILTKDKPVITVPMEDVKELEAKAADATGGDRPPEKPPRP